jgi:hypothetical protein
MAEWPSPKQAGEAVNAARREQDAILARRGQVLRTYAKLKSLVLSGKPTPALKLAYDEALKDVRQADADLKASAKRIQELMDVADQAQLAQARRAM